MVRFASWLLAVPLGLAIGCSSSKSTDVTPFSKSDEFQEVAGMLRDFVGASNRGPANAGELARFQNDYPRGSKSVQAGEIVIVWGAKMGGEGGGGSDGVIAYEKKAATEGGWVLLANGTVKELSAAQFASAAKATK